MRTTLILPLLAGLLGTSCVSTGQYHDKIAELDKLRASDASAAAEREKALQAKLTDTESRRASLERQLAEVNGRLTQAITERDALRHQLDDTTALADTLKARLEKLGQNVEKLTSERGQLAQSLDEVKGRMENLRKQKAAAEARAATFRDLVEKLHSMIDAGQLKVAIRDGRMLIVLPNDVLFASGKTAIKAEGKEALAHVAQALATLPDRHFIVAGHTDTVPIHTARFPSNWELSTQRAVEVTTFLIENGMKPEVLAAAGYGEFDPVVPNDSPEHMAQNRRIEIVLQPNIADLPSMDEVKPAESAPAAAH